MIRNHLINFFVKNEKGEGYIDVLVKILITVVLGALLLGLLKIAIPDIFSTLIDKIKGTMEL